MNKKILTAVFVAVGAYLLYRKYNDFSSENYVMEVDGGFMGSATGFLKTSFDSAISYGQEDLGMNFSIQLLDYLKAWEEFSPTVYSNDGAGVRTIGYGHKLVSGDGFNDDTVLTEVEATGILLNDIAVKQRDVKRYVKIPLSQHQFDALVSFTFNAGGGAMKQVAETVNSGGDVTERLARWVKGGRPLRTIQGLVNRRNADIRIWNSGIYRK